MTLLRDMWPKMNSGQFKPGGIPKNKLHLGSITIRIDKKDNLRRWVKVGEPNTWELWCVFIWKASGKLIPEGKLLHHVDFDSLNDSPTNLQLVTRKEHMAIHRTQIRAAVPSQTHIKSKTCPDCGLSFEGRGKSVAKCADCKRMNHRRLHKEYRERKRDERYMAKSVPAPLV